MPRRTKAGTGTPALDRVMAVADPSRWEILRLLSERRRSVGELAEASGLSLAVTSRHLQRLREAGLVEAERQGKLLLCARRGPETPEGLWLSVALGEAAPAAHRARVGVRAATAEPPPTRPTEPRREPAGRRRGRSPAPPPEPRPKPGGDIDDFLL